MARMTSNVQDKVDFPAVPFLGISDRGSIVLFTDTDGGYAPEYGVGVLLSPGTSGLPVGHDSDEWCLEHFKVFKGSVTVSMAD